MGKKIPILWQLLLHFMKIGLFTFGGGYAMIGLISDTCVNRKHWIDDEEMMNLTVIAESTPGPIAINCATYVGQKQAGFPGSVIATLGIVVPSFVVIYLVSSVLTNFLELTLVAKALRGIKVGVSLLILTVGLSMLQKMQKKAFPRIVCGCAFGFMVLNNLLGWGVSTITLMIIAGITGFLFFRFGTKGIRQEVWSSNPHTRLVYSEYIELGG